MQKGACKIYTQFGWNVLLVGWFVGRSIVAVFLVCLLWILVTLKRTCLWILYVKGSLSCVYLYAKHWNEWVSFFLVVMWCIRTQAIRIFQLLQANQFLKTENQENIVINSLTIWTSTNLARIPIDAFCYVRVFSWVRFSSYILFVALPKKKSVYIKYKYTPTLTLPKQRCERYEWKAHAFNKCKLTYNGWLC